MLISKYLIGSIITLSTILTIKLYIPLFNEPITEDKFLNYNVTIYRDTWGVLHIFGEKEENCYFFLLPLFFHC